MFGLVPSLFLPSWCYPTILLLIIIYHRYFWSFTLVQLALLQSTLRANMLVPVYYALLSLIRLLTDPINSLLHLCIPNPNSLRKQRRGGIANFLPREFNILAHREPGADGKSQDVLAMKFRWDNVDLSPLVDGFQKLLIVFL